MTNLTSSTKERDLRLDFFRGLALVTIFINHVPGNVLEHLTTRNFGFSDAAEAFVLMSGMAAGLAYAKGFISGDFTDSALKVWRRAGKLYSVHIAITLAAILILMTGLQFFGEMTVFRSVNARPMLSDPFTTLLGVFTLGHQLGYFNILPLYMVLLAATPFLITAAARNRFGLLVASIALWLTAGVWQINFPNYPTQGGWFLNPFSWQLIYVVGLLAGMAAKRKEALVPFNPVLFVAAGTYLVYSFAVVHWGFWNFALYPEMPSVLGAFDKTYLSLQRLLHVLALAYVVVNLGFIRKASSSLVAAPINMLGRNSLSVFATGSLVCIVLQVYKSLAPTDIHTDMLLLAGGLAVQYVAASGGINGLQLGRTTQSCA